MTGDVGAFEIYIGHKEHMERSIDRRRLGRATEDVDYGKQETFSFVFLKEGIL